MKLLTKSIESKIPKLYANEEKQESEIRVYAKYFHVRSNWSWYATEYDAETKTFFGFVDGLDKELGYFSLTEMEEVTVYGLGTERDLYWNDKTTLEEVMQGLKS